MEVLEELQFEVENQTLPICITLRIVDDTILETDEYFFLNIIAFPPVNQSLSSQPTASVIILDDDSKLNVYNNNKGNFTFP